MLGKVFKHEMKATAGWFLPMFIGFVVITILCKLSFESSITLFSDSSFMTLIMGIFFALYTIYIVVLVVMTFVLIVTRFYKTMAGEQGYLTNTLPVKSSSLILAKLFSAVIWELAAILLPALSFLIFPLGHISNADIQLFLQEFYHSFHQISMEIGLPWLLLILTGIVALISQPLMFYTAIAAGHLFRRHRAIWSVVVYFVINTVIQMIEGAAALSLAFPYTSANDTAMVSTILHSGLLMRLVFGIVLAVIYYVFTTYVFTKRLNLD